MTTHPKCGKSWSGHRPEHCAACGETFTGTEAGDLHRVGEHHAPAGTFWARRCLTPAEMVKRGMEQDDRGMWRRARPDLAPYRGPTSGGAP